MSARGRFRALRTLERDAVQRVILASDADRGRVLLLGAARDGCELGLARLRLLHDERASLRVAGLATTLEAVEWEPQARGESSRFARGLALGSEPQETAAFEDELRAALVLAHPGGKPLAEALSGPPDGEALMALAIGLLRLCEELHQRGYEGWGLAPDRVWWTEAGPVFVPLDLPVDDARGLAALRARKGPWLAPEWRRQPDIDRRADLWAVGAILHDRILGGPPQAGQRRRRGPQGSKLPGKLLELVWRLTSLSPADRPPRAREALSRLGVEAARVALPPHAERLLLPSRIGREELLSGLLDPSPGGPPATLIEGPIGSGRERLLSAASRAEGRVCMEVELSTLPELYHAPLLWLLEGLEQRGAAQPALRELVDGGELPEGWASKRAIARRLWIFERLGQALLELAAREPLLLIVHDLERADAWSRLLIEHLIRLVAESRSSDGATPLRLLISWRRGADAATDAAASALVGEGLAQVVTLAGLEPERVAELCGEVLGCEPPLRLGAALARAYGGAPRQTISALRALIASGRLYQDQGWRLDAPEPESLELPTVPALGEARLGRLREAEREVLLACALLERPLSAGRLRQLLGWPAPALLQAVDGLRRGGWISRAPRGEALVLRLASSDREAILQRVGPELVADRRRRLARRLVELPVEAGSAEGGACDPLSLALAAHLGGDGPVHLAVARQARRLGHPERAAQALAIALAADGELGAQVELAGAQTEAGELEAALATARSLPDAAPADPAAVAIWVEGQLRCARLAVALGRWELAAERLRATDEEWRQLAPAVAAAERRGLAALVGAALGEQVLPPRGRGDDAGEAPLAAALSALLARVAEGDPAALEAACRLLPPRADEPGGGAAIDEALAACEAGELEAPPSLLMLAAERDRVAGRYLAARDGYRLALGAAERREDYLELAAAMVGAGEVLTALGDRDQALPVLERVRRLAREWGEPTLAARAAVLEGRLELLGGRLGAGTRVLQQAVTRYEALPAERGAALSAMVALAATLLLAEQPPRARRWVERAEASDRRGLPVETLAYHQLNLGLLALADGDLDGAAEALARGVELAEERLEPAWQLAFAQARLASARGDEAAAAERLAEAQAIIGRGASELDEPAAERYRGAWLRAQCLAGQLALEAARATGSSEAAPQRRELLGARTLLEINKQLGSARNLDKLLEQIMDHAIELTRAERAVLLLEGPEGMQVRLARDYQRRSIEAVDEQISRSLVRRVVQEGKALVATNAAEDASLDGFASVADLMLRSVLCVPLAVAGEVGGALYLDNRFEKGVFDDADGELLGAFADQAALALRHARLHDENARRAAELEANKRAIEELNRQLEATLAVQSAELSEIKEELAAERGALGLKYEYGNIVGGGPAMRTVFKLLDRVVDTQVPVYIHGESGTGKELVARAIHFNGPRRERRFVVENCGALTPSLLESELFGYVKGAFTGAERDKKGLFEQADGGTLFLDEIGEMSPQLQKALLRALQEGEIRRVGGKEMISVDVRVISATHRDLSRMVSEGEFREDLYYRLNVLRIDLPPLRERREDLAALVDRFLDEWAEESGEPRRSLARDAVPVLAAHTWPGNIRELRNVVFGVASLTDNPTLTGADFRARLPALSASAPAASEPGRLPLLSLEDYTRQAIESWQDELTDTELAKRLGVSRKTLWEKRKRLGLPTKRDASKDP